MGKVSKTVKKNSDVFYGRPLNQNFVAKIRDSYWLFVRAERDYKIVKIIVRRRNVTFETIFSTALFIVLLRDMNKMYK